MTVEQLAAEVANAFHSTASTLSGTVPEVYPWPEAYAAWRKDTARELNAWRLSLT